MLYCGGGGGLYINTRLHSTYFKMMVIIYSWIYSHVQDIHCLVHTMQFSHIICRQGLSQRPVHPSFRRAFLKVDRNWTGKNFMKEINKIVVFCIVSLFHCSYLHHIVLISKLQDTLTPRRSKRQECCVVRVWVIFCAIKTKFSDCVAARLQKGSYQQDNITYL